MLKRHTPGVDPGCMKPASSLFTAIVAILWVGCSGGGSDDGGGSGMPGGNASPVVLGMEDDVHALINGERVTNALGTLVHDDALRRVARAHSEDMINRSFFSHTDPDGRSPFDRMAAASISFIAAGENIAWNMGFADPAQTAVTGWMNSAGHRANILNTQFTHAGLGAAQRQSDGAWYFTQVFSRPTGSLVLTSWIAREQQDLAAPDQGSSSWSIER